MVAPLEGVESGVPEPLGIRVIAVADGRVLDGVAVDGVAVNRGGAFEAAVSAMMLRRSTLSSRSACDS